MVRKEYNNTDYSVSQINDAIKNIVHNHKENYRIDGNNPDSVKLLCRTGYNWTTIAEIMWDKADAEHNDIIIECRNSGNVSSSKEMQLENAQRHLSNITALFFKYMSNPAKKKKWWR